MHTVIVVAMGLTLAVLLALAGWRLRLAALRLDAMQCVGQVWGSHLGPPERCTLPDGHAGECES